MDNDNDKTLHDPPAGVGEARRVGEVTVTWEIKGTARSETFTHRFKIGRSDECDVRLGDGHVSRSQCEIYRDGEHWYVRDLGSTHGTYLNGVRIAEAPLPVNSRLQFHIEGPVVEVEVEGAVPQHAVRPQSVTGAMRRYFGGETQGAGANTLLIIAAFKRVRLSQRRRYLVAIGAVVVLLLVAVGFALLKDAELDRARAGYVDMFYVMSELKLQIAQLEQKIEQTGKREHQEEVGARRERLRTMEQRYDSFLEEIGLTGERLSPEDQIIFRVARMFGECELTMPEGFVGEVKEYIKRWQSTERLARAVKRLRPDYHVPFIFQTLLDNHLPPQLMYLALQESDFKEQAVGPRTRYGIAKGMWQFTPATAHRFGLRTGPLVEMTVYDPADERFNFEKATEAAGRFLRELYYHDAQASGLLVMASYNWGPGNIRRLIRGMPENPRERNFWKLIEKHEIPEQTHDFVFYTISAIAICEDPGLFGFSFTSPLAGVAPSLRSRGAL